MNLLNRRNLLIILIIVFACFFLKFDVHAETFLNKFEPEIHIMNTYEMSDDEIYNLYNKIIDENYLYNHVNFTIEDYINARNKLKTMYKGSNTKYIMYVYAGSLYYKTISSGINPGIAIYTDSNKKFGINFGFNSETIGSQTVYIYNSSSNSFSSNGSQRMFGSQLSIYDMTTLNRDIADLFETNCHSDSMQYYLPVYGSNKYSGDITYNNQVYSINSYLPIDVYKGLNSLYEAKPKLNYKTGFTSSEAYEILGKVSIEFSENDISINKFKYSQFKLQYGSNDFTRENIPIFSHYKIFGKRTSDSSWVEIDLNELNKDFDNENGELSLNIVDNTFDYAEGMLADASTTFQMDFLNNINTEYQYWMIEFYFDNTNNGYIYVYDTLNESKWNDTAKFLEDYMFYYFPTNYRYAIISSDQIEASGKIYVPTNHIKNNIVRLKTFYYNYSMNMVDTEIDSKEYDKDNYYSYFDFNFKYEDKKCVIMSRKLGELYISYYDQNFLTDYFDLFNDLKFVFDTEISYFYVPIGFTVKFSSYFDDKIIVNTPNGFIDNDSNTIFDNTNYDIYTKYNTVSDMFSRVKDYFNESKKYMRVIIKILTDFYNKFNDYIKAFIEFVALFILIAAVVIKIDKRE